MNIKTISISFLFALVSVTTVSTITKSESLEQRCQSNRSDCDAIYDSSKLIDPTYKRDEEDVKEQLGKLGWDKSKTSLREASSFIDPKDPEMSKKVAIDAQVVISQKEVNGKTVYLFSFRGTEVDLGNIAQSPFGKTGSDGGTDLNVGLTEFGVGKVHSGFFDYVNSLEADPKVRAVMKEILDKQVAGQPYEVIVTGHSLGGAAAQLFAARLVMSNGVEESKIKNIVFGSPSVGDQDFTEAYLKNTIKLEANLDTIPNSTRVVNTLPSWWKGGSPGKYYHDYGIRIQLPSSDRTRWWDFKDAHMEYTTQTGLFYEQQFVSLLNNITSITQGSSSHIGSASYYLGRSPNQDPKIELEGVKLKSAQETEQYTTPAGSITNLKAPVDVVLNWNQSVAAGQLDLDSHLTGPTSLGDDSSVRFHTYFSSKGSSTTAPYVLLYRDVIPPISSQNKDEQTRIQVLQNGVYRFYVHDFTNREITNSTALSQSGANVTVFNGGQSIPTEGENLGTRLGNPINIPTNQQGNVWRAFELDSRTGVLKPFINAPFGNVSAPASVPTVGQNAVTSGGTVGK
jgi:hypothetical protein